MPRLYSDDNFERDVLQADVPVLVMFSAPWAGPCNIARPTFESIAERYGNQMDFGEFVLDDNPDTPERFGVRAVPAFYLFEGGVPLKVMVGAVPEDSLFTMIEDAV